MEAIVPFDFSSHVATALVPARLPFTIAKGYSLRCTGKEVISQAIGQGTLALL